MKLDRKTLQKIISEEVAAVRSQAPRAEHPRDLVLERWQKLAGISEGPATDEIVKGIKDKKIKNNSDLADAVKGYAGDDLKDLEGSKGNIISAVKGDSAFPGIDAKLEKIIGNLKKGGDKSSSEGDASKGSSASPSGEGKSEGGEVKDTQAAAAAVKTFKGLIADARKTIKAEEVSDEEMGAVMGALDKLSAFKIKA